MNFNDTSFHTEKAKHWLTATLHYSLDDRSLAAELRGHYELGELAGISEALMEASRLYRHKFFVEVERDPYGAFEFTVVKWVNGEGVECGHFHHYTNALAEMERLTGNYADSGWLKENQE